MQIIYRFCLGLLLALVVMVIPTFAQQSWIWSRDDNSKPIKLTTDSVSLVLLESRVPSGDNFVANDSQVGLLINIKFEGQTAVEKSAAREFPLLFLESTELLKDSSHKNSKNIGEQRILVNYFPLTDGDTLYRGISVSLILLRKQEKAGWTKVLDTLLSATKGVSLPSPLSIGFTYVNKFSTDVLQQYLPDPNKEKRIDLGTLSFLVSNNPKELNRVANTGLHLKVLQPTASGPGWVDPSKWANYCFYTKFEASNWSVFVAPKDPTATDKDAAGCSQSKYTQLMNDYIPILIEAQQTGQPTPSVLQQMLAIEPGTEDEAMKRFQERANNMRSAAAAQCKAYIKSQKCPVLKSAQ